MLSHQVFETGDVLKATAMKSGEILIQARRFEGSEDLGGDKRSAPTNQVSGPSPHNCPSSAFQMQIQGWIVAGATLVQCVVSEKSLRNIRRPGGSLTLG